LITTFAATLLAVMVLAVSGCTTALSPGRALATAGFARDQQGRILSEVAVNGHTAQPFVVDTAASISALYAPYQQALGLTPTGRSTLVHGLNTSQTRELLAVESMSFAGLALDVQRMVALPAPPAHRNLTRPPVGIIGQDVLANYQILFARDESTASWFPTSTAGRQIVGWRVLPLQRGETNAAARAVYFLSLIHISEPTRPY